MKLTYGSNEKRNVSSLLLSGDQLPFERNVVCGKEFSIYSLVVSVSISRYVVAIHLSGWDVCPSLTSTIPSCTLNVYCCFVKVEGNFLMLFLPYEASFYPHTII